MINIKSDREIELMKKAGHINYLLREELKKNIKPGITTKELDNIAYKFIKKNNCNPSFLNYEGYPASICISINDEVVHGIPSRKRIIKEGDIVSIDVGVEYKGYHSDAAETVIVGSVSDDIKNLVENTEKSLYKGLSVIKDGVKINEIGSTIEIFANEKKLGIVRELVGHGVGTSIHEDPDVPNYYTSDNTKLKAGMVIAVEPMLTLDDYHVYMEDDDWTIKTCDGCPAAHFEHTVLVTKDGYEILTGE